jgi:hypothetical protein
VSTTPVVNLPLLSRTPAVNFATGTAGVVFNDTGGKYGKKIILLTTDNVNLKEKIYLFGTTQRCPNKIIFWLKIFSFCHRCRWHWWCTLSYEEFLKKRPYWDAQGFGEKLIHEKKPEVENLVALTL